ncbi:winged helix-turn-helix domain-containing protein [Burkholderia ubonensis]|uniref:winged helix-turn-helix domain-containing protein n=1 Tax=Burkholderia ubonensis TaxID=101571 RepID=UPI0012FC7FC5|nr:winged helix-turn-helix domain-containing protein [Burkholderia ubonensis]
MSYRSADEFMERDAGTKFDLAIVGDEFADEVSKIRECERRFGIARIPIFLIGFPDEQRFITYISEGADYYERWPMCDAVVIARARALMKFSTVVTDGKLRNEEYGPYIFNLNSNRVILNGVEVVLTRKEFLSALVLFRAQGRAVKVRDIWDVVWFSAIGDRDIMRTLTVHIARAKRKLNLDGRYGYRVVFVVNEGYMIIKDGD